MIKKKVPYTLLTATALATLLSSTAFAAKGDFYYGDASNLTRVQKSEVKDKKDILKANKDKLYYQIDDTNIVKYSDYLLKIVSGWATGSSIGDAVTEANGDETVRAGSDIVEKAAQVDNETETIVSSVSAINATTIQVVLKDKPAADLTVADASKFAVTVNGTAVAAPTAVTKVASDLTGKTYKLTIATLNGQQGDVAVNGTKAGVATGLVYGFDYKAPSVTSVVAKGPKTIQLQFDEKLNPAIANIATSNFTVSTVVGGAPNVTNTAVLDSTGTKVTLTLANSLTVADYVVTLGNAIGPVNITDVAGNGIYNGTQVSFRPTASDLQNTAAPSLVSAVYDKVSGKLTIALDKNITAVDTTKLSVNGVALTASDVAIITNNTAVITLSDATKTSLNALTGALTLTSAKDAYGDATTSTSGETLAISLQQPAVVKTVAYDQQTNKLVVTFDQAVTLKATNVLSIDDADEAGSAVVTKAMAVNTDGTAADTTVANATWTFDCSTIAGTIEGMTSANLKAYILAGAVTNGAGVDSVAGQETYAKGVVVSYAADTTKPTLVSAEYNNHTGKLVLTFSEKVDVDTANINHANIKLWQADGTALTGLNNLALLQATETAGTTSKTLTYNVGGDNANLALAFNTGKTVKITLDASTVKDEANLNNDAITYAKGGITLTNKDYSAPTVSGPNVINQNLLSVTFSEPVDQATAETVANYVITDSTSAQLAVTKASLQPVNTTSGTQTVYLTTATQTAGAPYKIVVKNVKDVAGNVMATTSAASFDGSSTTDVTALTVNGLIPAAPANSKNDTLTVGFNTALDPVSATNLNNYVVLQADTNDATGWANATQVSLTNAKAQLVSGDAASVLITLDAPNLQNNKYYKVVVSNVTSSTGKALGTGTGDSDQIAQLTGVVAPAAPSMTASQTATGAIKLVFDQELDSTAAALASNYTATSNGNPVTVTKATYSFNATTGNATVVLDLASAPATPVAVALNANIKNLAGVSVAGNPANATALTDNVAPTVNTVTASINDNAKDDTIVIAFNDSDVLGGSATSKSNYVVKDAQGTVIPAADYTVAFNDNALAGKDTVTLTFDQAETDKIYNLQADGTYTVAISGILDNSGNAMTAVTKTATLNNTYKNGDTVNVTKTGTVTLTPGSTNVFAISGADTDTIGDVTITAAHVDVKKASASDFSVRVYDASGQQVTLNDTAASSVKTLLFGQLSGGTPKQLVGNISMNYGQLKTAMNNVAGTTVGSVQVDLFDLAGNKTTVTLNIQ